MSYQPGKRSIVRCANDGCTRYLGAYVNVTTGRLEYYCDRCHGHTRIHREGDSIKKEFVPKGYNPIQPPLEEAA